MLLVDLAYMWFGAPHQDFQCQDDLQATACFLSESADIERQTLAVKLVPNQPLPRFQLALNLAALARFSEAHEQLRAGLSLDGTSWFGLFTSGAVELYENHANNAVIDLQQCVDLGVDYPPTHYFLGAALELEEKLKEAREQFRIFVENSPLSLFADSARERIAKISGLLDTVKSE